MPSVVLHLTHRRGLAAAVLLLTHLPGLLAQQPDAPRALEAPSAPVAVLSAALYNEQANLKEASDSSRAELATAVLRGRLAEQFGPQLVSSAAVDSLAASPDARAIAGTYDCSVRVTCATMVAGRLGARWVVLTKVSKTSNLIWLLTAQLIRVSTGEIVLDDSTELKGDPEVMVRAGIRIFADRVVRTVRNGGVATDFPAP